MLHEDIEDFRTTLKILVDKLEDIKGELDVEKLNNIKLGILEQKISKKNSKNRKFYRSIENERKYLQLLEIIRKVVIQLIKKKGISHTL
jgi:hypothetical protein